MIRYKKLKVPAVKPDTIHKGDSLAILRRIKDNTIDLVCTDPPYGISMMGKKWDKAVPSVAIWKECLRVLKPGAFAFVMCGPRQDCLARMLMNMEEAGFVMKFTSIYWTHAMGFPKAGNIAKKIEKRLGGATPESKALKGSFSGFQPKPAVEVVIVGMKPLSEKTYIDQAMKNSKGVSWFDDCRIPIISEADAREAANKNRHADFGTGPRDNTVYGVDLINRSDQGNWDPVRGRFPANLLVSDDALNDGTITKSPSTYTRKASGFNQTAYGKGVGQESGTVSENYGDSGSYSRYFDLDAWWTERIRDLPEEVQKTFPYLPVAKPAKSEKTHKGTVENTHPTVKPLKLMSYLITMGSRPGDVVLDPFCGSGTTCVAAKTLKRKYIGIDQNEQWVDVARKRLSAVDI